MNQEEKDQLVELVKQEAALLKQKATTDELNRLSFIRLRPNKAHACVYGLMTNDCFSERAHLLISECCSIMYLNEDCYNGNPGEYKLNGGAKETIAEYGNVRKRAFHFSPIETFIAFPDNNLNGNNELLIDYLKGQITELNFKPF